MGAVARFGGLVADLRGILHRNKVELAALESLNNGKALSLSNNVDVPAR